MSDKRVIDSIVETTKRKSDFMTLDDSFYTDFIYR